MSNGLSVRVVQPLPPPPPPQPRGLKMLVCGGRHHALGPSTEERDRMFTVLDWFSTQIKIGLLIHGAAPGADTQAGNWAHSRGVTFCEFPALWQFYKGDKPGNGRAGPIRNSAMLKWMDPDLVVAFPGGPGTADMMHKAGTAGVPVIEVAKHFAFGVAV